MSYKAHPFHKTSLPTSRGRQEGASTDRSFRAKAQRNKFAAAVVMILTLTSGSQASAQVFELLWGNSPFLDVTGPSSPTLDIYLTAGSEGVRAFSVSVDYSELPGDATVLTASNGPLPPFQVRAGILVDDPLQSVVGPFDAANFFVAALSSGQEYYVGSIQFSIPTPPTGCVVIDPFFSPITGDGVVDGLGFDVSFSYDLFPATICGPESPQPTPTATPEPGSVPSKCDALKNKFVGKKVFCKMKVFAKAAKKLEPPDASKLNKCDTKFIEKCQKAEEKKGDCSVFGNCASLADDADGAADALTAAVLMP